MSRTKKNSVAVTKEQFMLAVAKLNTKSTNEELWEIFVSRCSDHEELEQLVEFVLQDHIV